jgi:hypothetical protein
MDCAHVPARLGFIRTNILVHSLCGGKMRAIAIRAIRTLKAIRMCRGFKCARDAFAFGSFQFLLLQCLLLSLPFTLAYRAGYGYVLLSDVMVLAICHASGFASSYTITL